MEEIINKRKIKSLKIINGKFLHKKMVTNASKKPDTTSKFIKDNIKEGHILKKEEPKFKVSPFQLVVIKLPWYKRAVRSLMSFLGFYYD